ncbi:hypothetical protein HYI36_18530 [Bacillus sp. Gen3]|nr:hypothetical protein [Bacillus sp. Gen3]
MPKIFAPNKQYTGVSASVTFANGVGETDSPHLIKWFEDHGYEVEEVEQQDPPKDGLEFDKMSVEELKLFAENNGIDIGNATSENGIIKKIKEATEKAE